MTKQEDYAYEDRLDSIWRVEHPWLSLGYRVLGLGLLTGCAIGTVAMAYRLVAWVLRWW